MWRCVKISKQEIQINEEIRDKEVRVIDAQGGDGSRLLRTGVFLPLIPPNDR